MENPNTWTLLHHDLARASHRRFQSLEERAAVLHVVLENNKVDATYEDVLRVITNWADGLEQGICGKSLVAILVDTFKK